jgi:hypothetical protein
MKYILFILVFLISLDVDANSISISIDPAKPLMNEPFSANIVIETTESERPSFSFNPRGVEVLDRREEGVSTQTTIINGQISMKRIYQIRYSLMADKPGTVRLTEVKASFGNRTIQGDPVVIDIVRERSAPRMFFVRAEPTKEEVYVGEGINLEYYLYFRVPVVNLEILEFPKLNGFIKRFHMTNDHHETVEFEGTLYRRRKAYSARIYPERTGDIVIDPIRLNVHYSDQASGSLSAFGFSTRQQSRSIFSENVTIKVLPLPTEDLATDFIGLVGEHDFQLIAKRNRFLKNEVVEIVFEVEGEGALENLSPPNILSNSAFERFDVKQEFRETSPSRARKIFNYTYIARDAIELPARELSFSYFSTIENEYKSVQLQIPEITIADNEVMDQKTITIPPDRAREVSIGGDEKKMVAPFFSLERLNSPKMLKATNYLVLILSVILVGAWLYFLIMKLRNTRDNDFNKMVSEIRKNGPTYQKLFMLFDRSTNLLLHSNDLRECISESKLGHETKRYFLQLLDISENAEFVRTQQKSPFKFEKKYFDELYKNYNKET